MKCLFSLLLAGAMTFGPKFICTQWGCGYEYKISQNITIKQDPPPNPLPYAIFRDTLEDACKYKAPKFAPIDPNW